MSRYPIHTIDSAPAGAGSALEALQHAFGVVPNLAATMANSPPLVNAFVAAFGQFGAARFTDAERQVLLLSNAVANRCSWAVAFHSTMALKVGVAPADVAAIRRRHLPTPLRLAALATVTRKLIDNRGHLDGDDTAAFTAAGYDEVHLFEVVIGLAISTMANYVGNIARPPVEQSLQAQAWDDDGY